MGEGEGAGDRACFVLAKEDQWGRAIDTLFKYTKEVDTYPAGAAIFSAGEPGDLMYLIKEGEVDIRVNGKVVETVGPNGMVGEMALVDASPRSATAVAKTDCSLIRLNADRFTFLVQQTPDFALDVMRVMVDRIRRMNAVL